MRTLFLRMPIMALVLGLGLVISQSAFKPSPSNRLSIQYQRTGGTTWELADPENPETCAEDEDLLCKAYFDYNPTGFSDAYNRSHLDPTKSVEDNGYVPQ